MKSKQVRHDSPRPAELKEFDAFLKRELPRTIRKTLQAALETSLGPIEETLKNELENIVRNAQETLTRSYLRAGPSSAAPSKTTSTPAEDAHATQTSSAYLETTNSMPQIPFEPDVLSQYFVPPDTVPASSSFGMGLPVDKAGTSTTWSDSAYHSLPDNVDESLWDNTWFSSILDESDSRSFPTQHGAGSTVFNISEAESSLEDHVLDQCTGKGKGRADGDTIELNSGASYAEEPI
jgi:hypothetical protein